MSATWDSKAVKTTPILADEILIIDTEDSRNQKRATIDSIVSGDSDGVFVFSDESTQQQASTPDGITGDVSTAKFLQEEEVATEGTTPEGVFFKPDGTKMFIVELVGSKLQSYDLTTSWDVKSSSPTFAYNISEDALATDVFFRPDGLKMYIVGRSNVKVYEYDLATAWVISSGVTFVQDFGFMSVDDSPHGLVFRPDGLKMFIGGQENNSIYEFDLTTAWNITTASATADETFVVTEDAELDNMRFSQDGTNMYVLGQLSDTIYHFTLSTPWDISTSTALSVSEFDVSTQNTIPTSIFIKPDNAKLYLIGVSIPASIFEFDLGIVSKGISLFDVIDLPLLAAAPVDPDIDVGRLYVKEVDANNHGLFIKIKQSDVITEVQIV